MAQGGLAAQMPAWREAMRRAASRSTALLVSLGLLTLTIFTALALVSYRPSDPALNTAASGPAQNWLGGIGAYVSEALLVLFGPLVGLLLPLVALVALRLWRDAPLGRWPRSALLITVAIMLVGSGLTLLAGPGVRGLPLGWGGVLGYGGGAAFGGLLSLLGNPDLGRYLGWALAALLGFGGLYVWYRGLALDDDERAFLFRRADRPAPVRIADPKQEAKKKPQPRKKVPPPEPEARAPVITDPKTARTPAGAKPRQRSLNLNYDLPTLVLLNPPAEDQGQALDKAALERNARLLESVLDDFHVKGQIVEVRPGPVVTMYELEPASGIKASRVIQLADDIARNMSAISARVAVIPGRSVIGIELPNAHREMVVLSEMIASAAFEDHSAKLPIILGKNIAGDPVIADLAPMPHLLVAGTTGSGKSVGLNCMILSLLYRLTPEECKLIMIDPKMLELSIYDDIPHLLSPVVTEPAKAVRALKWAVEQMEERYRMLASLSVRSLQGFNDKVRAAKAKGKPLGRRVQTGYDADTGQPVYEEEELEYEPLPQIVIVVDELADLMMTAGKEVEFLIQRLAQKARAAGIHLIMATQRPSVDVITGVIKANLPTRISFSVTSKIDSRTILGEQGAEQLLGKGDMLYMPGGKQIARVHCPFVSDEEVRRVADHWREQGQPEYIQAVTEEPEDGGYTFDGQPTGEDSAEDQLYRKACQIVAESQKASTSYIQRQLRVGYNNAARLIERMEAEGKVSAANHVGRREVLIDQEGNPV
ncbi:MAG: DNA translocase FtsK 4TM domain-containing protein [Pseudomonadota bacterium]